MKIFKYKCYQCGFCCKQSACSYGKWDAINHRCEFLTAKNKCGKYKEIIEHEKHSTLPMMGCGCSSPMCNTMRNAKIKRLGLNPEAEIIELDFSPDFDKLWEKMEGK